MNLEDCQTVLSSSEGEPAPRYSRGCLSFVSFCFLISLFFFLFSMLAWSWCVGGCWGKKQTKIVKLFVKLFHCLSRSTASTIVARRRWVSLIVSVSLGRDHRRCRTLGIAFRRTRGNSHGSRSRDSAVPIPARRGSTYPLATARTLKHKKHRRTLAFIVSDWYRFENIWERERERNFNGYIISYSGI